jgi:hypothetical protein
MVVGFDFSVNTGRDVAFARDITKCQPSKIPVTTIIRPKMENSNDPMLIGKIAVNRARRASSSKPAFLADVTATML